MNNHHENFIKEGFIVDHYRDQSLLHEISEIIKNKSAKRCH
jgi:hypothetical protein